MTAGIFFPPPHPIPTSTSISHRRAGGAAGAPALIRRGERVLLDVRGRAAGAGWGCGVMAIPGEVIPLIGNRFGVAVSSVARRESVSYLVSPLPAPAPSVQLPPPRGDGVGGRIQAMDAAALLSPWALLGHVTPAPPPALDALLLGAPRLHPHTGHPDPSVGGVQQPRGAGGSERPLTPAANGETEAGRSALGMLPRWHPTCQGSAARRGVPPKPQPIAAGCHARHGGP